MVKMFKLPYPWLLGFMLLCTAAFSLDVPPKPNRLVNDYAGVMSSEEQGRLERKLVAYNDSTSTQIAVVTVASLEGDDLFDYSQRLAESWGIGGAENDNGILLLIAMEEHEIRIHTGYGVEGALPDAISKRIIENEIKPAFKANRFYDGIDRGTDAMIAALAGEYKGSPHKEGGRNWPFTLVVIIMIILFMFLQSRARRSSGYSRAGRRHYGTPWIGGFGGGGGSWGGGGGGGFGGFGGGSFGGGGASGRW